MNSSRVFDPLGNAWVTDHLFTKLKRRHADTHVQDLLYYH